MKEPKYKIYEGIVKDIFKQCLDEGRRPLTLFELITQRNQKKIPNKFYYSSTLENTKTGEIFDASPKQLRKILKEKDLTIWRPWVVLNLNGRSDANGDYNLDYYLGRSVGVIDKGEKKNDKKRKR